MTYAIIENAVGEDKAHIIDELLAIAVVIRIEFLLNSTEVHRLFDNVGVVWDLKGLGVNRLMENACSLELPNRSHDLLGRLLPGVKQRGALRDIRNIEILQSLRVL